MRVSIKDFNPPTKPDFRVNGEVFSCIKVHPLWSYKDVCKFIYLYLFNKLSRWCTFLDNLYILHLSMSCRIQNKNFNWIHLERRKIFSKSNKKTEKWLNSAYNLLRNKSGKVSWKLKVRDIIMKLYSPRHVQYFF